MQALLRASSLLVGLLLAGCASVTPVSPNELYDRNVVFTVPAGDATSNLARGYSEAAAGPDAGRVIQAVLRFHGLTKVSQVSIQTLNVEAVVAEFSPRRKLDDVLKALSRDKRVQSVQAIKPYRLMTYNDPYFSLQGSMNGDRIDRIHEISTGKDVVVGIIDTGVDRGHPELSGNIVYTSNLVAGDQDAFDLDEHGTAVAGVIGSIANNDLGIVGVAPDVRMMVFKACHQEAISRRTSCDSVSIIKALNDVLVQRPDVLNLSLAGPRDPLIERLLRAAYREGMVLVAAVDESQPHGLSFPASMEEVIAVGTAINKGVEIADTLFAPGTDVLTTTPGATYGFKSGSSMATAYVSGIVALMKEREPTLNGRQALERLRNSSRTEPGQLPVVNMCLAVMRYEDLDPMACPVGSSVAHNLVDSLSVPGQ